MARRSDRRSDRARRAPRRHRFSLGGVEGLERRLPLAANLGTSLWRIWGDRTPGTVDDTIVVQRDPANSGTLQAIVNGKVVGTRAESMVRTLQVFGGTGADTIRIDLPGNTRLTTWLSGGAGDDDITGGPGADRIDGGPGRDRLNGGDGADTISGGAGDDDIVGGRGNDWLAGDGGIDTLRGGAGRDTLHGGAGKDRFFGEPKVDRAFLARGEKLVGNESTNPLRTVSDADALRAWYVDTAMRQWGSSLGKAVPWNPWVLRDFAGLAQTSGAAVSSTSKPDHSDTNTQVAGVDEGDLVETDGRSLFVIAGDGVDILRAWPAESLAPESHVSIAGDERSMFLRGTTLTVLSQESTWEAADGSTAAPARMAYGGWVDAGWRWTTRVIVTVIDVSDTSAPAILESTSIDGWLVDARAVDGRVVVVTQDDIDIPVPKVVEIEGAEGGKGSGEASPPMDVGVGIVMPFVPENDGARFAYESEASYRARLDAAWAAGVLPGYAVSSFGASSSGSLVDGASTWVPLDPESSQLLSVTTFDVGDADVGPTAVATVAGVSGTVYASAGSLYVAASHFGAWWDATDVGVTTNVYRFDIAAPAVELASMGSVPGYVLDQFSMDEHDGLFRVATTNWSSDGGWNFTNTSAGVHVLGEDDGNLVGVGSVTGLAPGERIFSARFAGDVAYVSTFRQIDPLFVIDLSVPTAPRVAGELKIPGFSTLLQPLDANHLLGVGRDVDPVTGRVLGLQLSIFDVSDASKPTRVATHTFPGDGWASWSPAAWDHHALAWFPAEGILTLPVQQGDWWNTSATLEVFRVTLGGGAGFERLGSITHTAPVSRAVRIGGYLYSISADPWSAGEVRVHPIDDPGTEVAQAALSKRDESFGPIVVW